MELPAHLKGLYRHWDLHTAHAPSNTTGIPKEVLWFVNERIHIWEQKTSGAQAPYTQDPVLSNYRFCNIFRELDRQTIEIHTQLNSLRDDFPLWLLNMFYARMVARPTTVQSVGLLSFDKEENTELYERLTASPRPRYGTPYVFPVSVIQRSATPTRELFITKYLPTIMQRVAQDIETWHKESVYDGVERVLPLFGYRLHFLWTEVLIDVAYQFPDYIDLFKRFPIGPGSAPTFKHLSPAGDPSLFVQRLAEKNITTDITYKGTPLRLSAENWEGIGCEYRKYTNLTNGHGRKRLYKSNTERPALS
jgi:hypothetical protein